MNRSKAHSQLVSALQLALGQLPNVRAWKQATGVGRAMGDPSSVIRYGLPGAADITGLATCPGQCERCGSHALRLEVEVKTGRGRQSDRQRAFGEMVRTLGGIYIVARPEGDALEALRRRFDGLS